MKVLMLTRYSRSGASSRMRSFQYLPWFESAGIDTTVSPLFSDAYITGLQQGKKSFGIALNSYLSRVLAMLKNQSFDLVWIEKELLPWIPAWLERMLLPRHIPYVLDYDDAVFHYYDQNRNPLVRHFLRGKHSVLIKGAALVVAGNDYIADYARKAGARCIKIVPTVIDMDRYPVLAQEPFSTKAMPPCVGWIGQRSTASFLAPYAQLFRSLSSEGKARFSAVGIDATALGLPMASIPWSEQTEVASLMGFDIGIMPLVDEPFERGKCGYKLIQYMACGLPVVASPVGANCQIVEHCVNGFLAETLEQWEQALLALLADPDLRWRMGQAGRLKVEREYRLELTGPTRVELLKRVAGGQGLASGVLSK